MSDTNLMPALSPSEARQVDQTCDRFELAWKAGPRPRLEEYVWAVAEPVRSVLLRHLLLLDWDYRRRAGDDLSSAEYASRFPGDVVLVEEVGQEMTEASVSTLVEADQPPSGAMPTQSRGHGTRTDPGQDEDSDRYDLGPEVGHGGIGVVYRGRDRRLGRDLAIKVLREVHHDKPEARRRFAAEARVGSQLQHPAIVPVYEQGRFADGQPFFTMKLVEGHTLAALLRKRPRGADATPLADLPRLLGVFEQVCQAMAYAHARGVVHRDLKPANVMVGAFGEVQVMDWGFAKVLSGGVADGDSKSDMVDPKAEANGASQSGMMMGTPAYMPPEQARGEVSSIDPRADVFALGAILCEILTGRPPYMGASSDDVWRQATAGDVRDAHARLDACGADAALRELARRCLTVERADRPADAGAVAKDLTAYLASAQERLHQAQLERAAAEARAKAERRTRRWTLAAAAALLVGVGVASWLAVVATRAKHDALTAKETANAKEAETSSVLDFVQRRVFAAARPEGQEGGLGRAVTLRKALEAALPVVDKSFADQPLVEARLRLTLGESFLYLGEAGIAADQFHRGRARYTEHLGHDHPDALTATTKLANSYADLSRYAEAVRLYEETLAVQKAKLGPDHTDTLYTMNYLGLSYYGQGRYADALRLHQDLLTLRKVKLGPVHTDTIYSMNNVAMALFGLARYTDAVQLFKETLELKKVHFGPDHIDTLTGMQNLAGCYSSIGNAAAALSLFEEALPALRAKLGPDHPYTLMCMNNLANCHSLRGNHAAALKLYEEALPLQKEKLGADHIDTLRTMVNLAITYKSLRRLADALKLQEETLALQQAKLGPDHPETLISMNNLANTYAEQGRHADALQLHQQTLALRQVKLGPDNPDTLASVWSVAKDLFRLDRSAEAVPIIDDLVRRSAGKDVDPKLIPGVMNLRLRHFEKAKDVPGCRTTAELWEKLQRLDAESLYTAARYRAVTAKVLRATDPSTEAARVADDDDERTIAWLKQAVTAGYKDVAKLKANKDFDALGDRADFRALLWAMDDSSKRR